MQYDESPCEVEELGHTAEIGFRVRAPDAPGLFACAGQALFALMGAAVDPEEAPAAQPLTVESLDVESLLVDWLNELLYLFETTGKVYTQIQVHAWSPTRLEATVWGRSPVHELALDVKAVTYHQLQVVQDEQGWMAQVFLDI